jgi:hypothetical protein
VPISSSYVDFIFQNCIISFFRKQDIDYVSLNQIIKFYDIPEINNCTSQELVAKSNTYKQGQETTLKMGLDFLGPKKFRQTANGATNFS